MSNYKKKIKNNIMCIILSYMFKRTVLEMGIWKEDSDINVITHAKLKIVLYIYAIVYIIILRDNFSIM